MSASEAIAVDGARALPRRKPLGSPDGGQADIEVAALIAAISEGDADAPEVYLPGEFWDGLAARRALRVRALLPRSRSR